MLEDLLQQIRQCRLCEPNLPLGANPIIQASKEAKLLIIGQAPGTRVHKTSIPWNDPSGDRLRQWLKLDKTAFYDATKIAIMPMGLCYPGKGKSGDLPPRKECAPQWHSKVLEQLPNIGMTLLIGQYAQNYYLQDKPKTLTETVRAWQQWAPHYLPLPHPSPRNTLWLKRNPWFEAEVVPFIREYVHAHIGLEQETSFESARISVIKFQQI
ncbi:MULTISPECIES: uracil-DNA glycosylase family protein [Vibrio]|uniref:uracil-DNA glycosylase family protein n=1 Tax=Vibrio TaxID=662 RepID=UPI0001B94C96|nr:MULTISPECIES: uracil-DNA glycosylase family protein [Vibrio]EEX30685.1 uracil-DNA glycosylase [Vibrio coralliilyticus ATCC BAA-450]MCM5509532.1 uracil-DNA glycosylase family protein [Vibrio sp. SCSIO 43169]MDE3899658.1 uracil-DNA glycosylase family protein [Vibrio sp. CC007]QFT35032.1 Uracil DNA glycosylase superfamily protein [Vibrio sp. THAF64]QGM32931.1 Uracil DNA glycosylase superfamily protein [Vibrio sp. THAF191d]